MSSALHLTSTHTTIDGLTSRNPDTLWDLPLLQLFAQLVLHVGGHGTILIHPSAAGRMLLPTEDLPAGPASRNHPVAVQLRAAGWKIKDVHRWFTISHREYGQAHIGLTGFFQGGHFPLISTPAQTTAALAAWQQITGHSWLGGAGDAGNQILRMITYSTGRGHPPKRPEWWSWTGPTLPADPDSTKVRYPVETWYTPGQWRRPVGPDVTEISGLDRVRAYLSAMTCTKVAARPLEHTPGKLVFDKGRAGWWLVRLGPWELENFLPDPAGYPARTVADPEKRTWWLTSPRLELLAELAAEGLYEYEILDSWTAPATDILKRYGQQLREAWQATKLIADPAVQKLVRAGVKEAYRQAHGHWRSPNSSVQLPCMASSLVAQNAANTWRCAYRIGRNGGDWTGPWPVQIDTDSLYYPGSKTDVQQLGAEAGLAVWDSDRDDLDDLTMLGEWRTGGTLEYDPIAGHPVRTRAAA